MFSKAIFKQTLKANIKLWLIFTIITSVFLAILIAVFEPKTISDVMEMVKDTGISNLLQNTTFLGMLSSTFYTLHGVLLPVVYIILTANNLIANQVDRGSMAYLLSTPTKRSTIVITQAIYLIGALVVMFLVLIGVGLICIHIFQDGTDVDISEFLLLNVGLFLLMFATSSISFLFSCMFNLSKHALALGGGLPIPFFLFDLMASVNESLENFKYISLNTLFPKDAILSGDHFALQFIVLAIIGIILYSISIRVFEEKDLPL